MQLFLNIQSSDGAIASIPVGATGLRLEAEPGSIYKLITSDGAPVRGDNITVTRTGRDLSINGVLQTEPVIILDFFLACRFDTNCRFELETIGGERGESITPLTEAPPRQEDGSFLMWAANGGHDNPPALTVAPETVEPHESSFSGVLLGLGALGALGLAAAAGSGGTEPVGSDPTPAPAAPPPVNQEPEPSAPTVAIQSVIDNAGQDSDIALVNGDDTNDRTPQILGKLSESLGNGQTLQILRDGELVDEQTFEGTEFEFLDNLQTDGQYAYQSIVVGSNGETLSQSNAFELTLDTVAPERPEIFRVAGNNIISENEANNGIEVSGTAEANASITISWGDVLLAAQSDASGDWTVTFDNTAVDGGLSTITAAVTDQPGNQSDEQVRAVFVSGDNTDSTIAALYAGANSFGSIFPELPNSV